MLRGRFFSFGWLAWEMAWGGKRMGRGVRSCREKGGKGGGGTRGKGEGKVG